MPPSDKLIIDSHKTKIVIDRVKLSNFDGVDEPYVVMVLKNTSEVTAKNINISFISESKEIFAKPDGVREFWRSRNLAIESQKEALIPVAPLSEYTGELFENNPKARLLEFRLPDAEERPFSLDNKVCGNDPEIIDCNYETMQRSTVVKISYESIFDEEITQLQQWFNIFLLGEPKIMRSNG